MVDAILAFDDLAREVSFTLDSLAMVKRRVHESVSKWRWRMTGLACGAGEDGEVEGPLWEPVAALIKLGKWNVPGEVRGVPSCPLRGVPFWHPAHYRSFRD